MTRPHEERRRRWRLALGGDDADGLSERDLRMDRALAALYDPAGVGGGGHSGAGRRGGLGASAPRVARWLGDIREFFPTSVVQVIQRDAFERLGLKAMLMEPEFLATLDADVHLVADLIGLRAVMPTKAKDTARQVVRKVVDELVAKLAHKTVETIRGAAGRAHRTSRPRATDIDWPRTIRANLERYQPELRTVIPERLIGYRRRSRARVDADSVVLCVDQSGSMATSVVYSSIFAAVMATLPVITTRLVCFDTAILDLTDELADPVEVLFGVQLGGGTDINAALAYCEANIARPAGTHLVLISDLCEGGDAAAMLGRAASLVASGVNLIVLLALSDDGRPAYDANHAGKLAALGCPVFACTPDLFPDLMAAALRRDDIADWAAVHDIALVRASA